MATPGKPAPAPPPPAPAPAKTTTTTTTPAYPAGGTPATAGSFVTKTDSGGSYKVWVPTGAGGTTTTTGGGGGGGGAAPVPTPTPTPTINANTSVGKSTFFTIGGKAVSANTILSNPSQYSAAQQADALFATGQSSAQATGAPTTQTAVSKLFAAFNGGGTAAPSGTAAPVSAAGKAVTATPAYPAGGTPAAPVGGAGHTSFVTSPSGGFYRYFPAAGEILVNAQGQQVSYLDYGYAGKGTPGMLGYTPGATSLTTSVSSTGQTVIQPVSETSFLNVWQYDAKGNRIGTTPTQVSANVLLNSINAAQEAGSYSPSGLLDIGGGRNVKLTQGYTSNAGTAGATYIPGQTDLVLGYTDAKGNYVPGFGTANQIVLSPTAIANFTSLFGTNKPGGIDLTQPISPSTERTLYASQAKYVKEGSDFYTSGVQANATSLTDQYYQQALAGQGDRVPQTKAKLDALLAQYGMNSDNLPSYQDIRSYAQQYQLFQDANTRALFADNPNAYNKAINNLNSLADQIGLQHITPDPNGPNTVASKTSSQLTQATLKALGPGSYTYTDATGNEITVPAGGITAVGTPTTSAGPLGNFGLKSGGVLGLRGSPTGISLPSIRVPVPTTSTLSVSPTSILATPTGSSARSLLNAGATLTNTGIILPGYASGGARQLASPAALASSGSLFGTVSTSQIVGDILSNGQVPGGGTNFQAVHNPDGSYLITVVPVPGPGGKSAQADAQKYLDQAVAIERSQGVTGIVSRDGGYYIPADTGTGIISAPGTAVPLINPNPVNTNLVSTGGKGALAAPSTSWLSTIEASVANVGSELLSPVTTGISAVGSFLTPSSILRSNPIINPNPVNQNLVNLGGTPATITSGSAALGYNYRVPSGNVSLGPVTSVYPLRQVSTTAPNPLVATTLSSLSGGLIKLQPSATVNVRADQNYYELTPTSSKAATNYKQTLDQSKVDTSALIGSSGGKSYIKDANGNIMSQGGDVTIDPSTSGGAAFLSIAQAAGATYNANTGTWHFTNTNSNAAANIINNQATVANNQITQAEQTAFAAGPDGKIYFSSSQGTPYYSTSSSPAYIAVQAGSSLDKILSQSGSGATQLSDDQIAQNQHNIQQQNLAQQQVQTQGPVQSIFHNIESGISTAISDIPLGLPKAVPVLTPIPQSQLTPEQRILGATFAPSIGYKTQNQLQPLELGDVLSGLSNVGKEFATIGQSVGTATGTLPIPFTGGVALNYNIGKFAIPTLGQINVPLIGAVGTTAPTPIIPLAAGFAGGVLDIPRFATLDVVPSALSATIGTPVATATEIIVHPEEAQQLSESFRSNIGTGLVINPETMFLATLPLLGGENVWTSQAGKNIFGMEARGVVARAAEGALETEAEEAPTIASVNAAIGKKIITTDTGTTFNSIFGAGKSPFEVAVGSAGRAILPSVKKYAPELVSPLGTAAKYAGEGLLANYIIQNPYQAGTLLGYPLAGPILSSAPIGLNVGFGGTSKALETVLTTEQYEDLMAGKRISLTQDQLGKLSGDQYAGAKSAIGAEGQTPELKTTDPTVTKLLSRYNLGVADDGKVVWNTKPIIDWNVYVNWRLNPLRGAFTDISRAFNPATNEYAGAEAAIQEGTPGARTLNPVTPQVSGLRQGLASAATGLANLGTTSDVAAKAVDLSGLRTPRVDVLQGANIIGRVTLPVTAENIIAKEIPIITPESTFNAGNLGARPELNIPEISFGLRAPTPEIPSGEPPIEAPTFTTRTILGRIPFEQFGADYYAATSFAPTSIGGPNVAIQTTPAQEAIYRQYLAGRTVALDKAIVDDYTAKINAAPDQEKPVLQKEMTVERLKIANQYNRYLDSVDMYKNIYNGRIPKQVSPLKDILQMDPKFQAIADKDIQQAWLNKVTTSRDYLNYGYHSQGMFEDVGLNAKYAREFGYEGDQDTMMLPSAKNVLGARIPLDEYADVATTAMNLKIARFTAEGLSPEDALTKATKELKANMQVQPDGSAFFKVEGQTDWKLGNPGNGAFKWDLHDWQGTMGNPDAKIGSNPQGIGGGFSRKPEAITKEGTFVMDPREQAIRWISSTNVPRYVALASNVEREEKQPSITTGFDVAQQVSTTEPEGGRFFKVSLGDVGQFSLEGEPKRFVRGITSAAQMGLTRGTNLEQQAWNLGRFATGAESEYAQAQLAKVIEAGGKPSLFLGTTPGTEASTFIKAGEVSPQAVELNDVYISRLAPHGPNIERITGPNEEYQYTEAAPKLREEFGQQSPSIEVTEGALITPSIGLPSMISMFTPSSSISSSFLASLSPSAASISVSPPSTSISPPSPSISPPSISISPPSISISPPSISPPSFSISVPPSISLPSISISPPSISPPSPSISQPGPPSAPPGSPIFPSLIPLPLAPFAYDEGKIGGRKGKRSAYASLFNVMRAEVLGLRGSSAAPEEYERFLGTAAEQNLPTAEQLHGETGKSPAVRAPRINVFGGAGLRAPIMGTPNMNAVGSFGVKAPNLGAFRPGIAAPNSGLLRPVSGASASRTLTTMPALKPVLKPKPKGARR